TIPFSVRNGANRFCNRGARSCPGNSSRGDRRKRSEGRTRRRGQNKWPSGAGCRNFTRKCCGDQGRDSGATEISRRDRGTEQPVGIKGAELRLYFSPEKRPFAELLEGRE